MKRNQSWKIIYIVIFLLMVTMEALAVSAVIRLDMLPKQYLFALLGILGAFTLAIGLLLFWQGKTDGRIRKITAAVLALLLLCGCTAIRTVASDVINTLKATGADDPKAAVRAVYVLDGNRARKLEDTAGYAYGYVKNYDESCTMQALEEVKRQTAGRISTAGYTNAFLMANALLEGRIDAIVLNAGYLSILEDTEGFSDFSGYVRLLSWVEVDETLETENPAQEEASQSATEPTAPQFGQPVTGKVDYGALKPFAVYVSGSDSYDSQIVMNSRSDVNILAVVNPLTRQILLLNTPRDYYVENTAGGGKPDKLTHCGIYGTDCSMKTLGNLYGTQIDYYVRINFTGFKKLIDAMGGITVYSDYAFTAITRTPIAEGENHLTGQQALDFARERYTLKGGDNERGRHQMQVITAVIEKATSGSTVLSNYSEIMNSVEGMFSMNLPMDMLSNLMKMQLTDMAKWNIVSYSVTGTNAQKECYSVPGMELSVIEPSPASVSKASRLIDMIREGELLTEEVINSIV